MAQLFSLGGFTFYGLLHSTKQRDQRAIYLEPVEGYVEFRRSHRQFAVLRGGLHRVASIERFTADVGARAAEIQSTDTAARATGYEIESPKPIQSVDKRTEIVADCIHHSSHCDYPHRHRQWRVATLCCMIKNQPPNKSPEPTAVGACSSAIAVHAASRRWLSFFR